MEVMLQLWFQEASEFYKKAEPFQKRFLGAPAIFPIPKEKLNLLDLS